MTDPRDKPPHSKHATVKSKTRETQYLKYRSFKPKCVESRVAGYIKTKKSRADSAVTATISSAARLQQPHHQPAAKTSRSRASKAVATAGREAEAPSVGSEPKKRMAKRPTKHRLLHASDANGGSASDNRGKPHTADDEDERKHKADTNIQADPRKAHAKSKQRHQRKTYKTFDIASFPRVFSTSDLMEKMSQPQANAAAADPSANCEFQNVDLRRAPPTAQPPSSPHADVAQQLEFRDEDVVDVEITCHRSPAVEAPVFPHVDSMVFRGESSFPPTTPGQGAAAASEPGSSGECRLAPKRAREMEAPEQTEQRAMIDELHACVHNLQAELRGKGDVEQALRRSEDELRHIRAALSDAVSRNAILQGELRRNSALASAKLAGVEPEQLAAPSDAETALRDERVSPRTTHAAVLADLRRSQTAVERLRTEVARQEAAVRMLEDVKMASASQLRVYEAEMAFLRDANAKLALENRQLETRNRRLLNVLALNHVLALSEQFRGGRAKSVVASGVDAALDASRKRNRLQEIKRFNTSCQKFTTTE